jgi:hypothetical protein
VSSPGAVRRVRVDERYSKMTASGADLMMVENFK